MWNWQIKWSNGGSSSDAPAVVLPVGGFTLDCLLLGLCYTAFACIAFACIAFACIQLHLLALLCISIWPNPLKSHWIAFNCVCLCCLLLGIFYTFVASPVSQLHWTFVHCSKWMNRGGFLYHKRQGQFCTKCKWMSQSIISCLKECNTVSYHVTRKVWYCVTR